MHKVTFFPIGNADCLRIELDNGKRLLFDYANYKTDDKSDLRVDLAAVLREGLAANKKDSFDIVGFTHADDDHVKGSSEFFYFEHAKKYQSDTRIKISELWVPAAMVLEGNLSDDARIIRQEARYRLKEGKGVRIFSRPDLLKDWLLSEGIKPEERAHLITDAGKVVPGWAKDVDGLEFFVHSPFAIHTDEGISDRNECSLILHATFLYKGVESRLLLIGDTTHERLAEIVRITKAHKNEERLKWDIFDIPHHCSYLALNSEKGTNKTVPVAEVKWLLQQGQKRGIMVSPSNPIPKSGDDTQPPHRQAKNCYTDFSDEIGGEFKVTMEFPNSNKPEPMEITIDDNGVTLKKIIGSGVSIITSNPAPRAGDYR